MMNISLIVIHYGELSLTKSLLESLRDHPDRLYFSETIIVDNGARLSDSEEESLLTYEMATEVVKNPKESYSSGVNKGVDVSSGEALVISNNDIEWNSSDSIGPALATLSASKVGIVGPQQMFPDGSWQRSSGRLPSVSNELKSILFLDTLSLLIARLKFEIDVQSTSEEGYIDGAFLLVDRECFCQLEGFDEDFTFYGEEADFCLRAQKKGWKLVSDTRARIIHVGGASSSQDAEVEFASRLGKAKRQLVSKHYGEFRGNLFHALQKLSVLERVFFYSCLSYLFGGEWQRRAEKTKNRFLGIVRERNNES